jgi:hypothetical protein
LKYLGNLTEDQVIDFKFSTHKADGTPITLAGTPVVKVWKANATDSEVATGVTLAVDFDGVTGMHGVRIDTSDAFYAVANDYSVVITTGTVDGVSVVGTVLATFSIQNRYRAATIAAGDAATLESMVSGIGTAGGAAINIDATTDNSAAGIPGVTSDTTKLGAIVGAVALTSILDGQKQTLNADAAESTAPTIAYQFLTGGGGTTPISLTFTGYVGTTTGRSFTVRAWKFGTGWETIGTITGQAGSVNVVKNFNLYARHCGTAAAELGKVYIQFIGAGTNNPTLYVDQIYISYAITSRSIGYADGAVWVKAGGVDAAELYVNGTADNPCPWDKAQTIAAALGTNRFRILNGETVTLTGACAGKSLIGKNWTLALGSSAYSIASSYFEGATVSGTSTGDNANFHDCNIGAVTIGSADFEDCQFTGTFTTVATKSYTLHNCIDGLPGAPTNPTFVMAATVTMGIRGWSGGIVIHDMVSTDTIALEGWGRLILEGGAGTTGTLIVRGHFSLRDDVTGGFVASIEQTERFGAGTKVAATVAIGDLANNAVNGNALNTTAIAAVIAALKTDMAANTASYAVNTVLIANNTISANTFVAGVLGTVQNTADAASATTAAALASAHGAGSWATAIGFSTHSASDAASSVRTNLATELARIDNTVSSRSSHSASDAANSVRTNLATELARIDNTVSSRSILNAVDIRSAVGLATNNLDTQLGSISLNATSIRSAVGLATNNLDTQLGLIPTAANTVTAMQAAGTILASLNTTLEADGTNSKFTVAALAQAPSGTGSTPASIWGYATRTVTSLPDIDGLTADKVFTALLATAAGKVTVTDNGDGTSTAVFKKQNGTNTALTVIYTSAGARNTTPVIP